jgi:DNA polymerase-3 subunit epsilon
MVREIVLDTETTGLDARNGDRLIEVGCIELVNHIPTGRDFHRFINPQGRAVHPDAEAVHGISAAFLADKPLFETICVEFLEFLGDAQLVIHNASFDMGFINMELNRLGRPLIAMDRAVDTLAIARRKHPAGPNTLDGLCKRYGVDTSKRTKHGALLDAELLAYVYVELIGQRQAPLGLAIASEVAISAAGIERVGPRPVPLPPRLTADEEARHREFVETLGEAALWRKYALYAELPEEPART